LDNFSNISANTANQKKTKPLKFLLMQEYLSKAKLDNPLENAGVSF